MPYLGFIGLTLLVMIPLLSIVHLADAWDGTSFVKLDAIASEYWIGDYNKLEEKVK